MGKIGQARGFLFFRIVNKFFFRKRKKNKKEENCVFANAKTIIALVSDNPYMHEHLE